MQKEKYFVASKLVVPQTLFFRAKICHFNFSRGKRRNFCVDGLMTHFGRKFNIKAGTFKIKKVSLDNLTKNGNSIPLFWQLAELVL